MLQQQLYTSKAFFREFARCIDVEFSQNTQQQHCRPQMNNCLLSRKLKMITLFP